MIEVREKDPPPAELLRCMDEPAPPALGAGDRELAKWIARMRTAGQDCRGKLGAVAKIVGGR